MAQCCRILARASLADSHVLWALTTGSGFFGTGLAGHFKVLWSLEEMASAQLCCCGIADLRSGCSDGPVP